jgi:hypothetical protein
MTPNSEEFDDQTSSSGSSKSKKGSNRHNNSMKEKDCGEEHKINRETLVSSGNSGDNQGGVESSDSPFDKAKE